jgi:UDP-N-acetylglucosamine 2-epimerase (non-hydrolysing)
VPLLVLREETERPEAVEAGAAALVGTDRGRIIEAIERLWHDAAAYRTMQSAGNPFGDGQASQRIADVLQRHLAATTDPASVIAA